MSSLAQRLAFPVDRATLFGALGLIEAVNGFGDRWSDRLETRGLFNALVGLGGISVIGWFAFYAIVVIAIEKNDRHEPLRPADGIVVAAMAALALVPLSFSAALGLLLSGAYLAVTAASGSRTRRIGAVLLALTGPLLWGPILLQLCAPLVLGADAQAAALLAGAPVHGNVVDFVGAPDGFFVAPPCSSLHNMSLAVVLWVVLLQLFNMRATPFLIATGAAAVATMAAVNVLRLAAMARLPDRFDMLHVGSGAAMFGMLSLVAAGLVIGGGIVAHSTRARA